MKSLYNSVFFDVLFLWILTFSTVTAECIESCSTPSGKDGQCVPYRECDSLIKLLERYNTTVPQDIRDYIKGSRCNNNTEIHICCEIISSNTTKNVVSNAIFSGANYEAGLNPHGVEILASQPCGDYGERIAFSDNAFLGELPWMALLKYENSESEFNCGGTVITDRYVLTAAHCVMVETGKLIGVSLGEFDISTNPDCVTRRNKSKCAPPVLEVGVEKAIAHPSFNLVTLVNDVGLVKMSQAVRFHRYLKPICLPLNQITLEPRDDSRYFLSGWGYTETGNVSAKLQRASIQYQNRPVCADTFKQAKFHVSQLCVDGVSRVDACKGDTGGPFYTLAPYKRVQYGINYRWIQFGIIPFGDFNCGRANSGLPGVYANVIELMPWITNNID